ncbi:MAG TPA: SpoIVB peptidase S55 domain-containing protein [Thermoanaerobaculaceae bacterium]|nr:SpoIVB peptidase S55 domain-containing protein [Thermoanaerobaculaceae bacterium]HRS14708.1 SpoIVB peptidase S55 domain-containing protein [Thermoanaerobaculaceae bacterium]
MLPLALALALAGPPLSIDPAEVRPGQRGTCVTEWTGGERRETPVEVVGVMDATGPERTTVLVRLLDPALEDGGVVAGMSGSPVWLDGKLLGAVAYGWSFAREPLAGVTPFAAMREIGAFAPGAPLPPPTLEQLAALAAGRLDPLELLPRLPAPSGGGLPVAVAGLPGGHEGWCAALLARAGLGPVGVAASGGGGGVPEPGEMMAPLLVWGDAIVGAGGTVTARDGDTLWAFGHPMFGLGSVRLPVARARVLAVQRSFQSSFKVFTVGEPFGTLVADRPAGVLVQVGAPPEGLPVEVELRDGAGTACWRFRVAEHPLLSPLMVTFVVNASLTARGAAAGDSSVRLRFRGRLADGQSLEISQSARSADAPARLASFAGAVTAVLCASELPHPALAEVSVEVSRDEVHAGAAIREVIPARPMVRPGETLAVEVRLQPYLAPPASQRLLVAVPEVLASEEVDLVVADGAAWTEYLLRSRPANPSTFAQQLASLRRFEPSTTLVAALESREGSLSLPGGELGAVPPSWAWTVGSGLGKAVTRLPTSILSVTRWAAPYPLEGAARVTLRVRSPRKVP